MQIDRLSLRGFRNYEDAQAQFVPGVNLLVGGNANGKTNLLEAVSYLSTGRSFRTRREAELIRFGADFAELRAQVQSQERTRELRAVLFSGRRPRQLWLAGVRQRSRAALSGVLTSVLFCPEDLLILKKGAAGRRRLMDGVICQLRPNYEAALAEYGRLLDQKSALLRERYDNPSLLQVLPEYDLRMAQTGALVISYRARYVKALAQEAARYHREFSGDSETLELTYRTVSTVTDPFARPRRSAPSCRSISAATPAPSSRARSACPARIRTTSRPSSTACLWRSSPRRGRRARPSSPSSLPSAPCCGRERAKRPCCCSTTCCPSWMPGGRTLF